MENYFLPMSLSSWRSTRNSLQEFARVLGAVRESMTPPQRHWYHISLRVSSAGLVTPPIPCVDGSTYDLTLDLTAHTLAMCTSKGARVNFDLQDLSADVFIKELLQRLAVFDIYPVIDTAALSGGSQMKYHSESVRPFWNNLVQIHTALSEFKGQLHGATSPVQLWPHHFDLALLWFSGRQVPGADPSNEEAADEQMNFGFSTGDEGISDPYFYITAYPFPEGLAKTALPQGAKWNSSWKGAVLMLDEVVSSKDPKELLMKFWRSLHDAGSHLMK